MDPDANLREQLELASKICFRFENEKPIREVDSDRLASLVIALDEWIRSGGSLPSKWGQ